MPKTATTPPAASKMKSQTEPRTKSTRAAIEPPPALHVLVRVKSENGLTLQAHAEMIASRGKALVGKLGKALGAELMAKLNGQVLAGRPTFLFLTTREGWNGPYVTDRCRLRAVHSNLAENLRSYVPSYYGNLIGDIKTWFEVVSIERLSRSEMNRIFVKSSGREIMGVIASSATVFGVEIKSETV